MFRRGKGLEFLFLSIIFFSNVEEVRESPQIIAFIPRHFIIIVVLLFVRAGVAAPRLVR